MILQIPILLKRSATGENKIYHNPHFKWLFKIQLRKLFARYLLKLKCECLESWEKEKGYPKVIKGTGSNKKWWSKRREEAGSVSK